MYHLLEVGNCYWVKTLCLVFFIRFNVWSFEDISLRKLFGGLFVRCIRSATYPLLNYSTDLFRFSKWLLWITSILLNYSCYWSRLVIGWMPPDTYKLCKGSFTEWDIKEASRLVSLHWLLLEPRSGICTEVCNRLEDTNFDIFCEVFRLYLFA